MNAYKSKCIAPSCLKLITGLSCENPEHQQLAAAEIAACDAGIPLATSCEDASGRQIASNHLMERPLGTSEREEAT